MSQYQDSNGVPNAGPASSPPIKAAGSVPPIKGPAISIVSNTANDRQLPPPVPAATSNMALMLLWMLGGGLILGLVGSVFAMVVPYLMKDAGFTNNGIQLLCINVPLISIFTLIPIIAFFSDRHQGPNGRRIPYLRRLAPIIPLLLFLMAIWKQSSRGGTGESNILVLGMLLAAFQLALTIVGYLYSYLINDVVPAGFLARFTAIAGILSTATGYLMGIKTLPFLLAKWQWIPGIENFSVVACAIGVLFGVVFITMCYLVRETQYNSRPYVNKPGVWNFPPSLERKSIGADIVASLVECFGRRRYWYFYLSNLCLYCTFAMGAFVGLRNRYSLGIDMRDIAWLSGATAIVSIIIAFPIGWLGDKFHPFRMYVLSLLLSPLVAISQGIWIFTDFGKDGNMHLMWVFSLAFLPIAALRDGLQGPMFMRLLPKSRFAQFCTVNGMLRALSNMFIAVFAGWLMNAFSHGYSMFGVPAMGDWAYRLWPIWSIFWLTLSIVFALLLYREWKKCGEVDGFASLEPCATPREPAIQ